MADRSLSEIIQDNPIGKGLDAFRASFHSICEGANVPLDALHLLSQEDLQNLVLILLSTLQILPASRLLRSGGTGKNLFGDLSRLNSAVNSNDFDLDRIKPLLNAALVDDPDDARIWDEVYHAVTEPTPPPRPVASSIQQTPWLRNTGSFANSSEHRKYMDGVLRDELGVMYVGLRGFSKTFFGAVAGLQTASEAVFKKCMEGSNPLFSGGWSGWPEDANQDDVLSWFADLSEKLAAFVKDYKSTPTQRRRPLAQPNKPIQGSTAERKIDVSFVDDPGAGKDSRCHWSQILVPGELKWRPSTSQQAILFDISDQGGQRCSAKSVAALEGCVKGHESLYEAGFLHRDISINNLMINDDDDNPSWPSFLIDLDLAIKEQREGASGTRGKTGTRAFMAIGALLGEQHSFMHDLESFFWVMFWTCIHYNGPDETRVVPRFDKWNYVDTEELAGMKLGVVAKEAIFMKTITDNFTPYYAPLIPLLNRLRKVVFPKDKPWEREDEKLYSRIRDILRQGWEDLK